MQENTDPRTRQDSQPEGSLPFFTRFLEGQHQAERSAMTRKFPSDSDEAMTMKYPSDGDDNPPTEDDIMEARGGAGSQTSMTLKYPSDRDEIDLY